VRINIKNFDDLICTNLGIYTRSKYVQKQNWSSQSTFFMCCYWYMRSVRVLFSDLFILFEWYLLSRIIILFSYLKDMCLVHLKCNITNNIVIVIHVPNISIVVFICPSKFLNLNLFLIENVSFKNVLTKYFFDGVELRKVV
jgi:hypothetical protein